MWILNMNIFIKIILLTLFINFVITFITSRHVKKNENSSNICTECNTRIKRLMSAKTVTVKSSQKIHYDNLSNYCQEIGRNEHSILCSAIMIYRENKHEFIKIVRKFSSIELCALLFMNECRSQNDENRTKLINYIKFPPEPRYQNTFSRPIIPIRKNIRFLQLTDLHIEYKYRVGAEADCCITPLQCGILDCCVAKAPFWRKTRKPAEYWGTLAACDIPYWTAEALFQHLNKTREQFDFGLLSGDYASHRTLGYTRAGHRRLIANLSALIDKYLPGTPFYWTIGNHEGVPINQFAPHSVLKHAPKSLGPQWIYRTLLNAGAKFLPLSADASAIYRGSYSAYITSNIKLITLNTGYCLRSNFWLYLERTTDPDETLAWLVGELSEAEVKNHVVYILGHVPPGYLGSNWYNECFESWSINYYRIVNRFNKTIAAQFYGHTHTDLLKIFYSNPNDPKSPPTNMIYISPSLTTSTGLNPAYRIYTADYWNGQILDYDTYFLNLTKANIDGPSKMPKWELLYSAKTEYGLKDLSAESWNNIVMKIESNLGLAKKFIKNFYRRNDLQADKNLIRDIVCRMRSAHKNSSAFCDTQ